MAILRRDPTRFSTGRAPATFTSLPFDPAADTVEMDINLSLLPNYYVGVQQFDGSGDLIDAATAGSYAVTVKAVPTGVWEVPVNTTIDATAPETQPIVGPVIGVRVTPAGVTGVSTARVVVAVMGN